MCDIIKVIRVMWSQEEKELVQKADGLVSWAEKTPRTNVEAWHEVDFRSIQKDLDEYFVQRLEFLTQDTNLLEGLQAVDLLVGSIHRLEVIDIDQDEALDRAVQKKRFFITLQILDSAIRRYALWRVKYLEIEDFMVIS
jgi:hypothetical protein